MSTSRSLFTTFWAVLVFCFGLATRAGAQEPVSLVEDAKPNQGWTFGNGQEFPGATGGLSVDEANKQNGRAALKLASDFTKGGAYVQAERGIDDVDIRDLSMWIKNPDSDRFTLRLRDASGQTHQLVLGTEKSAEWQRVALPVEQFFSRDNAAAAAVVKRYEYWGGSKDGKWHGPANYIAIIVGNDQETKARNFWFANVSIRPKPAEIAGPVLTSTIRLDELTEGEHDWLADAEGKAKASLTVVKDDPAAGQYALQLKGDFNAGGAYVAAIKNLGDLGLKDLVALRFKLKSQSVDKFALQLLDGTGQTHQVKGLPITPDGAWHDFSIRPSQVAGGEHWGGANDGRWHGEPQRIVILMNQGLGEQAKQPSLLLSNIQADVTTAAVSQPPAYKTDFEADKKLPDGWTVAGNTAIDTANGFKGAHSLLLSRPLADINAPISAQSPAFNVTPGQWQFSLAAKSSLKSPDASYSGTVVVEYLDAAGKVIDKSTLADIYGQRNWQAFAQNLDVPRGAQKARFQAQINKAEGQLWLDELSAAYLAPAPQKDNRVSRVMFTTTAPGNLFFPDTPRVMDLTVQANKPLADEQRKISYELRDYWGAEQTQPAFVTVERKEKRDGLFIYEGKIDFSQAPLEVGRYYEVHAFVPGCGGEPFHNYTSLAILPEAQSHKYSPAEIPFTSRSWDNRVPATIELSNRLGIRIAGIWGGWSEKAPYDAWAPTLDVAQKLGMGWLTGTPAQTIEAGQTKYDETALRQGVRNFIAKFSNVRPMIINLGNEPHGTGDQVSRNVDAYRILYEEIKKTDPTITVVATSVEPNEEYFKAGYGKYCDAYDFHIYESAENVRKSIEQYRVLMKKYGVEKPIWSTELGLNSQGLPRQIVAAELFRKFATFFAAGGANVSWFGMLYPDGDGKLAGTSGEAHNVFDARYNRYAPKLDAIAYYNAINAILVKKFVEEKKYAGGINAFLFRDKDGQNLQILWTDKGRQDVALPLSGVGDVQVIRVDGRRSTLSPQNKGVTLTLTEDPVLVTYQGGAATLPVALGEPAIKIENPPAAMLRGAASVVTVALNGVAPADVEMRLPPFWKATKSTANGPDGKPALRFSVTAPQETAARSANMAVVLSSAGKPAAELTLCPPVAGQLALQVLPIPATDGKSAGVRLQITNNSATPQQVNWDAVLDQQRVMAGGKFSPPATSQAYFAVSPNGALSVAGGETAHVDLPLIDADTTRLYHVRATITDATGRALSAERMLGGFVAVPHAKTAPKLDGVLDDAVWQNAPVASINKPEQFFTVDAAAKPWKGPDDLSAAMQFTWDEKYLYAAVKVTDDVAGTLKQDDSLWAMDGLQLLVDPARALTEKAGKYDYVVSLGAKGPQAWSALSASALAPTGEARDILVAAKRQGNTGSVTYEIAFPWSRLAPFQPGAGANLGLSVGLNEDDGNGRHSFMTWFGNVHTKDLDIVGDLVLTQ